LRNGYFIRIRFLEKKRFGTVELEDYGQLV
jgi:hypothetical protein